LILTSHFIANITDDAPMGRGTEDRQSIKVLAQRRGK
jgi:hypothetical protein